MLQRDYIQRLIREFMAALERMLEKKEVEVRREKIKELYDQYVGPYAFYSIATIEDVKIRWPGSPLAFMSPRKVRQAYRCACALTA